MWKIIYTQEQIQERVSQLAKQISHDYAGQQLHLLAVLRGAIPFLADLSMQLTLDVTYDFLAVTRQKESGHVQLLKDLDTAIKDRHVLLVEDIINEGQTISFLLQTLRMRLPKDIKVCTMFDRPCKRKAEIKPDYVGLTLKDQFAVGYGLDYQQKYRNLPFLAELEDN